MSQLENSLGGKEMLWLASSFSGKLLGFSQAKKFHFFFLQLLRLVIHTFKLQMEELSHSVGLVNIFLSTLQPMLIWMYKQDLRDSATMPADQ